MSEARDNRQARETPSEQLDRMLADPDEYFRLAWAKAYADARAERKQRRGLWARPANERNPR